MQVGLVEGVWPHYGLIGKFALIFIELAAIAFLYFAVVALSRLRQLKRWAKSLSQPFLIQHETSRLEKAKLSSPDIKNPKFIAISEALREELPGRGLLSTIATVDQALDLLAEPFMRTIYYLKILGWGALLFGWLGTMSEILSAFHGMARSGSRFLGPFSSAYAEAILLQIIGLAVGLACLMVSSYGRSRLRSLHQELSDQILLPAQKK